MLAQQQIGIHWSTEGLLKVVTAECLHRTGGAGDSQPDGLW